MEKTGWHVWATNPRNLGFFKENGWHVLVFILIFRCWL